MINVRLYFPESDVRTNVGLFHPDDIDSFLKLVRKHDIWDGSGKQDPFIVSRVDTQITVEDDKVYFDIILENPICDDV